MVFIYNMQSKYSTRYFEFFEVLVLVRVFAVGETIEVYLILLHFLHYLDSEIKSIIITHCVENELNRGFGGFWQHILY